MFSRQLPGTLVAILFDGENISCHHKFFIVNCIREVRHTIRIIMSYSPSSEFIIDG